MKPNLTILFFLLSLFNFAQNIWIPYDFEVVSSDCVGSNQEIYISEVYDSNGDTYGVIELYNPTNAPINLSNYSMRRRSNYGTGAWTWNASDTDANGAYNLVGSIPANGTYLLVIPGKDNNCSITSDMTISKNDGINEKDQIQLLKNNIVIDEVECPDVPGSGTAGYVIRRNANAIAPKAVRDVSDWTFNLFPNDPSHDCSNLGSHTENLTPLQITNLEQFLGTIGGVTFEECKLPARLRFTFTSGIGSFSYRTTNPNTTSVWFNVTTNTNTTTITPPNFGFAGDNFIEIRDNHSGCIVKIKFTLYNIRTSPILQT